MAISAKTSFDGLWIGALGDDELLRRVCEAVKLIKLRDPLRYERIRKDVRRIFVQIITGAWGLYSAGTESCQIDSRFVASSHPIFIACIIVHEATHARLRRFGYAEDMRYRLEVACRKQEIAFARKVPDSQSVIDWVQARFPRADYDYSDEGWARRRNEGLVTAARDMGFPSWLVKIMLKIRGLIEGLTLIKRRVSGVRKPS